MKRSSHGIYFRAATLLLPLIIHLSPTDAWPQNDAAAAEVLHEQGKALMAAKRYAEACPKLAESQRLDPGMGTEFRLADCYENLGKIASAWSGYIGAADAARRVNRPDLEAYARERATALLPRLPKLTIIVPERVASIRGIHVKRDGTEIGQPQWNQAIPLDPGEHSIEVLAPKKKPWQGSVIAKESTEASITVPELEDAPLPLKDGNSSTWSVGRGVAVATTAGVGVAGVLVGSIFGSGAFSKWDEVVTLCGDPKACDAMTSKGRELEGEARVKATISTVGFVVGGAGVAATVILLLTVPSRKSAAPRTGLMISPVVGGDHVGSVVQGTF